MTEQQAIETIKYASAFNQDNSPLTIALDMAIKAMENQEKLKERITEYEKLYKKNPWQEFFVGEVGKDSERVCGGGMSMKRRKKQRAKKQKRILDACCGSRMFWFDKENPDVVFADNRELHTTLCDGRRLIIKPDVKMDFRNIPYENETFKMVVFDPPHLIHAGEKSWLGQKYGILPTEWKPYLKKGFDECMRVLETDGVLIFKWNEEQIRTSEILSNIGYKPLFGDKRAKTHWLVFMK